MATASVVLSMHVLCLFAPFTFTWPAFLMALSLYFVTGLLGITLSFHRNLSHRSFKLPKWIEYSFAYCGAQALQVGAPYIVLNYYYTYYSVLFGDFFFFLLIILFYGTGESLRLGEHASISSPVLRF